MPSLPVKEERALLTIEMFDASASEFARASGGEQHGFDQLPDVFGAGIDQCASLLCRKKRLPTTPNIFKLRDGFPSRVGRDEAIM